jgi:hypothetical protein
MRAAARRRTGSGIAAQRSRRKPGVSRASREAFGSLRDAPARM